MGYNSNFELKTIPENSGAKDHLKTLSGYIWYDDDELQEAKWYNVKEDVKEASKHFPNVLFVIDINGEEQGDIRRIYSYGATYEDVEAKIVIDTPAWAKMAEIEAKNNAENEERKLYEKLKEKYGD